MNMPGCKSAIYIQRANGPSIAEKLAPGLEAQAGTQHGSQRLSNWKRVMLQVQVDSSFGADRPQGHLQVLLTTVAGCLLHNDDCG